MHARARVRACSRVRVRACARAWPRVNQRNKDWRKCLHIIFVRARGGVHARARGAELAWVTASHVRAVSSESAKNVCAVVSCPSARRTAKAAAAMSDRQHVVSPCGIGPSQRTAGGTYLCPSGFPSSGTSSSMHFFPESPLSWTATHFQIRIGAP